jgi:hypothetical protein
LTIAGHLNYDIYMQYDRKEGDCAMSESKAPTDQGIQAASSEMDKYSEIPLIGVQINPPDGEPKLEFVKYNPMAPESERLFSVNAVVNIALQQAGYDMRHGNNKYLRENMKIDNSDLSKAIQVTFTSNPNLPS